MLFKNNPKIAGKYFGREFGVLKPGAAADVAVFDYRPFTPFSDANIDGTSSSALKAAAARTPS